ncbi:MAG: hypothetical protein NC213_02755 [Acetobacter sp.]|nr:hypothetical protein [Bacteroides sp.]MCM1340641.1 hypothetical protein [Acetobacter sp.]MCM1433752.1 hypothetical protein [Clostridiales bacterium]
MKYTKIISLILALIMVLSLAACTSNSSDSDSDNPAKQSANLQSGDITNDSTNEEIAKYYNEVMKISKADKSFQGDDNLSIGDVELNGDTKESVKNMILSIGNSAISAFSGGDYEVYLPYVDQDVEILPDDIESFTVTDNGDTLTLNIKPVAEENVTKRLNGPQGRFFEVYEDIQTAVSQVQQISFPDGVDDSLKIDYYGGTVNFTIDKETKKIISGSTEMIAILNITNAKVTILTLKSCTVSLKYKVDYPKTAEE